MLTAGVSRRVEAGRVLCLRRVVLGPGTRSVQRGASTSGALVRRLHLKGGKMAVQPPSIPPISVGPVNMSHQTEQLLQCPYNTAHTILRYRMQTHLHKCRKQHSTEDWGYCSHNGTHHMPRSEIEWHENHMCPDRHAFQASLCHVEEQPVQSLAPMVHIQLPEASEDWDDGQENHFDPAANAARKSLIRGIHCVPPAERKAFRQQHRRHIRENEEDVATTARLKLDMQKQQQEQHREAPLRPPRDLPKGFVGRGLGSFSPATPPQPSWTGLGRGRLNTFNDFDSASSSTATAPPTGAWGRGRPKF